MNTHILIMTPKDRVALIIATGLVTWGLITIGGAIYRNRSLTEGGSEWFIAIGGALAAMLAVYLTGKNNGK